MKHLPVLLIIAPLLCCLFSSRSLGQSQKPDSTKIVLANTISFHSEVLGEERKIEIYTPALNRLEQFPGMAFPVLYLMDGDALTDIAAASISYLSDRYLILPPMIIVGIHNYDKDRLHDLTPTQPEEGFGGNKKPGAFGGGEKFLQFITTELMPYVNNHYKTEPFNILAGHSMSALLAVHCLIRHPEYFNAYIAISPSLWWDSSLVLKQAAAISLHETRNRFLFLSDGSEGGSFHAGVVSLDSLLKQKQVKGLTHKYIYYPDESHGSEPLKALPDALKFIYPQWYPGAEDSTNVLIAARFGKLSERYGYTILPPEWFVAKRATRILGSGKKADAIGLFELNTKNYPASTTAWEMLGDAYEKAADKTKALAAYRRASAISPGNSIIAEKIHRLDVPAQPKK